MKIYLWITYHSYPKPIFCSVANIIYKRAQQISFTRRTPMYSGFINSNTGSAVANFVNAMPLPGIVRSVVGAARNAAQATRNAGDVRKAMQATVPTAPAPMPPSRNARLNELLLVGSAGAGASTR